MQAVIPERRWLRFSLDRPCYIAQIALWLGRNDLFTTGLCFWLLVLALLWR